MIVCLDCNTKNDTKNRFCCACGTKIQQQTSLQIAHRCSLLIADGYYLLEQGRAEEALLIAQVCIKAEPESSQAWIFYGDCQLEQGKLLDALASYQRANEYSAQSSLENLKIAFIQKKISETQNSIKSPVPVSKSKPLALSLAALASTCFALVSAFFMLEKKAGKSAPHYNAPPITRQNEWIESFNQEEGAPIHYSPTSKEQLPLHPDTYEKNTPKYLKTRGLSPQTEILNNEKPRYLSETEPQPQRQENNSFDTLSQNFYTPDTDETREEWESTEDVFPIRPETGKIIPATLGQEILEDKITTNSTLSENNQEKTSTAELNNKESIEKEDLPTEFSIIDIRPSSSSS